jgi:phospholipase C
MTKKYLRMARAQLSRRRVMQTMGSLLGTAAFGCGDAPGDGDGSTTSTSGDGSSGGPTTGEPAGSSSGEVMPTTSGMSGDGSSSTGDGSSTGDPTTGDGSSTGDDTTGEPFDECGGGAQLTPEELLAGIDHIIVLVMENRSFDHYFGSLKVAEGLAVEGLVGDESNLGPDFVPVPVFVMDEFEPRDPPHEWDQCHFQFNLGENNGFVVENEKKHPGFGYEAMGYHVREHLPVTYGLADNFTICQRWFCSVMGPTWPNRYYIHACTSGGGKTNFPDPFLKTLWHRCDDAGLDSRIYFSDVPWVTGAFPLVPTVWGKLADGFEGFSLNSLTNPNTMTRFFADAESGDLPNFAIIDPGFTSNDDHPSHNIQLGQILIGSIYKALAEGPKWAKTLLIITYDEHGGFYDHVPPPKTVDELPEFTQLGFRVPSMVIGPSVRRGCVNDLQFEHCSIGATLMKRFGIVPLNERMAQARDVSSCIHPDYIADPQPGPPVPLVDVSISEILADVGHTTSQEELFLAAGVTIDEDFKRKVRDDTMQLLLRAQKLGVARLRP